MLKDISNGLVQVDAIEDNNVFPVALTVSTAADRGLPLTLEEARELAQALLDTAREVEETRTRYVQVQLGPNSAAVYTYRDPSGDLKPGDAVTVSGAGKRAVGTVMALGRGAYPGEVYEWVTGKVVPLAGQGEGA